MVHYGAAIWFAVLSVSPAICHEHPDGEVDHSHGLGLISASPLLVSPLSQESNLAPQNRHYHIVLFGIEITILPGCAALDTGIIPARHDSAITLNADFGPGMTAEKTLPHQDLNLDIPMIPMDEVVPFCPTNGTTPQVDSPIRLADPACPLCSGTQQI